MASRLRIYGLVAIGGGLSLVGFSALILMALRQKAVNTDGGCWADGKSYCAMANGRLGEPPFSARPLVPFAARVLRAATGLSVVNSFRVIAVLGFVGTVAGIAALAWILSGRAGFARGQAKWIAGLSCALWAVSPFGLRFVLAAPVTTDAVATALFVVWLALLLAPLLPSWAITLSALVAALAVLSRETAIASVVLTCIVGLATRVIPTRLFVANCLAGVTAFAIDLAQPYRHKGFDLRSLWATSAHYWLRHPQVVVRSLFMGVGFAVIAILPTVIVRLARVRAARRYVVVLIPAGVVPIGVAFGALDFGRIASAATPVLCVLLASYLVTASGDFQRFLIGVAVALLLAEWEIFAVVSPTRRAYVAYFLGVGRIHTLTLTVLAVIGGSIVLLDLANLSASSGSTSSELADP